MTPTALPLTTVPDLKEIATCSIAIALWDHIDMPYAVWQGHNDTYEWWKLREKVLESTNNLPLPESEIRLVTHRASKVYSEMESWASYHHLKIFLWRGSRYDLYYHTSKFVWNPNGTINYKKTALNLQSSLRLTDLEKFRFLCMYCLKDEIERRWTLLFENKVFDCVEFAKYPLIYYWNCYCKNELWKIPLLEGVGLTIDSTMFRHDKVNNWPAMEYFFDRMSAEEQVQNAIWLIIEKNFPWLQKLLMMKLTRYQRTQIYVNNVVGIFANYSRDPDCFSDILTTWFDCKDMINEVQFVLIIRRLLLHGVDASIVTEIWISSSDTFKHRVLNVDDETFVTDLWNCWQRTYHDSFAMLINVSADIRSELRSKQFFHDHCEYLIDFDKLSMLERVLNLCFPKDEELVAFKLNLTQKESFVKRCQQLIIDDNLSKFERVLNLCFCDMDNLAGFREHLINEEFFVAHCIGLTRTFDLSTLERLLNLCCPTIEKLAQFKSNFVTNKFFISVCKKWILENCLLSLQKLLDLFIPQIEQSRFKLLLAKNKFFDNHCKKLITDDDIPKLEVLSNFIFTSVEERSSFRRDFRNKECFKHRCDELIILGELEKLNELLNWSFPETQELVQFKSNVFNSSKCVKDRCSQCYATANSEGLNDLLAFFLSPRDDLMVEYKQNFLLSEDGFRACRKLVNRKVENLLNEMIADCLPKATRNSINTFKKKIIFSPTSIADLKKLISENNLAEVKICVVAFLDNGDDIRTLKSLIYDDVEELFLALFVFFSAYNYPESTIQSWICWWFQDEKLLQEYKNRIPVDRIFQELLKLCVFENYVFKNRHNCHLLHFALKRKFKFDILDRFLKWYFDSPKQIKEYKIRKMDRLQDSEVVSTMLKKCCHQSYWRMLTDWFFEKDHVEIAKFKKKNKGKNIASKVKFVRESYFKQK